jgi:hypothetical protein
MARGWAVRRVQKRRASGGTASGGAHRLLAGALLCFMLGLLLAPCIQSIAHAALGKVSAVTDSRVRAVFTTF